MAAHYVWRKAFITSLSLHGNGRRAAEAAGVTLRTAQKAKSTNPEFAEEWRAALEAAADVLEAEAWRRAHDGVDEPEFYKGEVCGTVRRYSDVLLIFLLKAIRPEKFREKILLSTNELDKLIEGELKKLRGGDEDNPALATEVTS